MRPIPRTRLTLLALALAAAALCIAQATDSIPGLSLTTPDRLQDPGWWPTKGTPAANAYVGEAACAKCHADIVATQHTTPMYHAGPRAEQSTLLAQHPNLTFHEGPYTYSIQRNTFSVSNGTTTATQPIVWAFGNGEYGQTYILKQNGQYTEARLSYYTSLHALDITTGHSTEIPASLQKAFGHALTADTAQHCFSCHTTAAVTSDHFQPEKAIPGVTCEACHGPGAKHVAAMTAGQYDMAAATILNPASLPPTDSVDFCGACHRTSSDVTMLLPANVGIVAVRFQPYRLEKSQCWGSAGDPRITCIACHDPHKPLVHDVAAYDTKCLACHQSLTGALQPHAAAPACKVSTHNCASCHMPRYEIPQTHASFTDHDIRIVRNRDSFPQ
ncbi:MAG: multiheme c-type cytochrome [Silvibacterium sp.]